jgi:hypothetical protein
VLCVVSLLVHLVTFGMAGGALAAGAPVPGMIICSVMEHGANGDDPLAPPMHRHLADCCLTGCAVAGGDATDAVSAAVVPDRVLRPLGRVFAVGTQAIFPAERQPFAPRGPPEAAAG